MEKKSGIYQIKNKKNNRVYIGSAVNCRDRKLLHLSQLRRNIHHSITLQRAYNKYGNDIFEFEVLEYCKKEKLIEREQYYLDKLSPFYNTCKKAHSTLGISSTRRKKVIQYDLEGDIIKEWECLQDIMKVFDITNSSKISQCCKLKRNKAYGFVWRYKDSDTFSYNKKRKGKAIALIDNNDNILKQWSRIKDCAKELNITSAAICNSLNPKDRRITVKGMKFKKV